MGKFSNSKFKMNVPTYISKPGVESFFYMFVICIACSMNVTDTLLLSQHDEHVYDAVIKAVTVLE